MTFYREVVGVVSFHMAEVNGHPCEGAGVSASLEEASQEGACLEAIFYLEVEAVCLDHLVILYSHPPWNQITSFNYCVNHSL